MSSAAKDARDGGPFQNRLLAAAWTRLSVWVREHDPEAAQGLQATAWRTARIVYLTLRDFFADRCMMQSAALTYATVLSLVPLLAVACAIAKGFGFFERLRADAIEPFLDRTWGPAGQGPAGIEQIRDLIHRLLDFVDHTDFSLVGTVGVALLFVTVLRLLSTVEVAFNGIWGVQRSRTIVRKLTDYLAMVVITPVFLFTATALTAAAHNNALVVWVREHLGFGAVFDALVAATPLFTMWIALFFVYLTLPNTRVQWRSALLGGIVAGTAWQIAQVLHVKFQIGIASVNGLYAGFAAFPLVLVWLYFSWAIVLAGAELCWAHQEEPNFRPAIQGRDASPSFREWIALRAMLRVARAFLRGESPLSSEAIALELGVAHGVVERELRELEAHGLVVANERPGTTHFLPARDPASITLKHVVDALRGEVGREHLPRAQSGDAGDAAIDRALAKLDQEFAGSAHNPNLRELVQSSDRESARSGPRAASEPSPRVT